MAPVIINEDCISVIAAKNATLSNSIMKLNLRFHCHENKIMDILYCLDFLFEAGDCLNLCLSFHMQCINLHVYSQKRLGRTKKKIIISWLSF